MGGKSNPGPFFRGEKACCHLGGNSILGRFFLGGKVGPGLIYPRGKFYTRPIFPGGKLGPGPFFRGESLYYNTGSCIRGEKNPYLIVSI